MKTIRKPRAKKSTLTPKEEPVFKGNAKACLLNEIGISTLHYKKDNVAEAVLIQDSSLERLGVKKGEYLLVIPGDHEDDLLEETDAPLSVWAVAAERYGDFDLCVCFATDNWGDITLTKPDGNTIRFTDSEARAARLMKYGVVVGTMQLQDFRFSDLTSDGTVETEINPMDEISVTCDDCGTTIKGSKAFLTSLGWRLRKKGNSCVGCW